MRKGKKGLLFFLVMSLIVGQLYSTCWAQAITDPTDQGLAMMDLLVARPASFVAGVIGAALFVVTLPVTASTNSVETAGDMFVSQPVRWALEREFPDTAVILPADVH